MKKNFTKLLCILMASLLLWVPLAVSASKLSLQMGDFNDDGKHSVADYVLLKKHVMGNYEFRLWQTYAADINLDGKVNTADYVLLKRAVMGTAEFDYSWRSKEYDDMTDEELRKYINFELAYPHEAGVICLAFEQGVTEEEILSIVSSFGFSSTYKTWENLDGTLHTDVHAEEEQLRDLLFLMTRHEKIVYACPEHLSFPD